jgi:hypothetical protein
MQSLLDSARVLLRGGANGGTVLGMYHAARSYGVE